MKWVLVVSLVTGGSNIVNVYDTQKECIVSLYTYVHSYKYEVAGAVCRVAEYREDL